MLINHPIFICNYRFRYWLKFTWEVKFVCLSGRSAKEKEQKQVVSVNLFTLNIPALNCRTIKISWTKWKEKKWIDIIINSPTIWSLAWTWVQNFASCLKQFNTAKFFPWQYQCGNLIMQLERGVNKIHFLCWPWYIFKPHMILKYIVNYFKSY